MEQSHGTSLLKGRRHAAASLRKPPSRQLPPGRLHKAASLRQALGGPPFFISSSQESILMRDSLNMNKAASLEAASLRLSEAASLKAAIHIYIYCVLLHAASSVLGGPSAGFVSAVVQSFAPLSRGSGCGVSRVLAFRGS